MTEQEKRLHRCCFTGHRPESIVLSPEETKQWLRDQILCSIDEGYTTFITGMGMGVDLWAAETVLELRRNNQALHLIATVPYPAFPAKWSPEWAETFKRVSSGADLVKQISPYYAPDALNKRNQWMVDHATRVIGVYNGTDGHTGRLVRYAREQGLTLCLYPFPKVLADPYRIREFPLNLLDAIMASETFQASRPVEAEDIPADFDRRLSVALAVAADENGAHLLLRQYRGECSPQAAAALAGMSVEAAGQQIEKIIKRLRQPDILRYLNCGIEYIPEKGSQTMVKRIEEKALLTL